MKIENLNWIDRHPDETVINDPPSKKVLGPDCVMGKVYQTFKEQISFIVYKFVPENKKEESTRFIRLV